jgi:hypothetical protein
MPMHGFEEPMSRFRWLSAALLAALVALAFSGCRATSVPDHRAAASSRGFSLGMPSVAAKAKENKLRKEVEKDSFPTASQAGL